MTYLACLSKKVLLLCCLTLLMGTVFSQYNTIVDVNGSGSFTTIQAAINAAPTGQTAPYIIYIKKGKYREVVTIPATKPFIQLIGESMAETIISYDNYSGKPNGTGGTYGTSTSATVNVFAKDCMLMNLSMENATGYGVDANAIPPAPGDGPQALALNVSADRVVFYNCRFNGGQDTVFTGGPGKRNYFKNCYIDGNTDFIFGDATAIFDTCVIYPRTRLDKGTGGYVTAVNTKAVSGYGYVFRDCKLSKNRGSTNYALGRPWQSGSGGVYNKTVFLNTAMGSNISAVGWSRFDANTDTLTVLYAEYNSTHYDSSLVDVSKRASWSHQLTATEAAKYYNNDTVFINANTPAMTAWDPVASWPVIAAKPFVPEVSVSNLLARKSGNNTSVTWNITFPMPDVTCDLYKSTDGKSYNFVSTFLSKEDTACNFSYIDSSLPAAGTNFYYLIKASKSRLTSITSDTGIISSTPKLSVSGNLSNIIQGIDIASDPQTYQFSGTNLTNNVTITPPIPFEVTLDTTTSWYTHDNPLVIVPTGNTIPSTTVFVRINGKTPGVYIDSIYHSTVGGNTIPLRVKGTMLSIPLLHDSYTLIQWPLTASIADNSAVRSVGIVPSVPAFSSVLHPAATAFSAKGIGFANDSTVGKWSVNAVDRNCYYQFSVVADSSHQIRMDSIVLNASVQSSANGTIAVGYSKSGFLNDSGYVASGIGTLGLGLPASNYGSFSNPASISKLAGNNDSTLRFLADSSIIINPSETLTLRLYFAVGSTNVPRYAYLKNVTIKGHPTDAVLPLKLLSFTANNKQGVTTLKWSTSNEIGVSAFVVEKSVDGVSFSVLSTVKSNNALSTNNYFIVDNAAQKGTNYYRLKMTDKDGKFVYSNVLKIDATKTSYNLYPNPVKSEMTVIVNDASSKKQAEILTVAGKKVLDVTIEKGVSLKKVAVSKLAKGQYLFVVRGADGEVSTQQFNKD